MAAVIAADKAHVWHHLIQHKPYEQSSATPRIIVHGSGMRVRDALGKEYIDAVSGGVWTVERRLWQAAHRGRCRAAAF